MERSFLGMEQVHIPCNLASIFKVIILEVKKKKSTVSRNYVTP